MPPDDRFDALVDTLGGFYRTWLIGLGIELGLFRVLHEAPGGQLDIAQLAERTGTTEQAVEVWAWAADAHGLAELDGGTLRFDPALAPVLLDDQHAEYLGGQFALAVVSSLDWGGMPAFFRTGEPVRERPARYREAIERLTVQDVAVFFQEVLAALPQLVVDLRRARRVVDVHCGGGRWLIAMARRFPNLELLGVEFEADSVERARANVADAGLAGRIRIEHKRDLGRLDEGFDLAYYQYALHQLPDPVAALRGAGRALVPGGRVVVLDWALPSTLDEFRTRHGELIAGVQLDEVYQGTSLATREQVTAWFEAAGLPAPQIVDLPSGATTFVAERP